MFKQYFKQALAQLKQQPVISFVSMLGTALSIFLIMLVVMIQQVKIAPFAPESNRDRFLHVQFMSICNKEWGDGTSNGPMSERTAKECYKKLTTPEAVTIYSVASFPSQASVPGALSAGVDLRLTDDTYWQVFDFSFIDGKPYDQATFNANLPVAVISESVARKLFGTTAVIGKEFLLNHAPYKISGVVKDVSALTEMACAQVWVPYTSTDVVQDTWENGHMGMMSVTILARDRDDFDAIREECDRLGRAYNTLLSKNNYELVFRNRPYDQEKQAVTFAANIEPDVEMERRQNLMIFIILLLVPAINLSSMTQSRLRQRVSEIGVRRAFGSTRFEIIGQIVMENFIVSLIAGIIGLLISVAFAYWGNEILFAQGMKFSINGNPSVDAMFLLKPVIFAYALGFCFLLNLLSSGLPAWRASSISIVNALGGQVHK